MDVHGGTEDSAVLVPLYIDAGGELHAVFTQRRDDLKRHAGEISFPGGRRDPEDADLERHRAARGARGDRAAAATRSRSSARSPPDADVRDQLRDLSVRRADRARLRVGARRRPRSPRCSSCRSTTVRAGHGERRLVRRGVPFRTDTYEVGDHLIWGATARIVARPARPARSPTGQSEHQPHLELPVVADGRDAGDARRLHPVVRERDRRRSRRGRRPRAPRRDWSFTLHRARAARAG